MFEIPLVCIKFVFWFSVLFSPVMLVLWVVSQHEHNKENNQVFAHMTQEQRNAYFKSFGKY